MEEAVRKIFDFNKSTLTQQEMADLETALGELIGDYFEIRQILGQWGGTKLGFKFGILKGDNLAEYNRTTRTITFREGQDINPDYFLEELLHAQQHNIYGEEMGRAGRNVEFEVKVFRDLIGWNNNKGSGMIGSYGMEDNPSYKKDYEDFIWGITDGNPFDIDKYNELYQKWVGYGYEDYSRIDNFDPVLIQKYF